MSQVTEQSVRFQTALASIMLIQSSAVLDLTDDDFDCLTSNNVWIDTDRARARRCFVTGRVGAGGACGGAHLRAVGFDVGNEEASEDIGGNVSTDEDGAVVVVARNDGSIAKFLEALEVVDGALAKRGGALKFFRCRS